MSHIRTQLREAFKSAIEAHDGANGYAVFAARKHKWNAKTDVALVDMMISNDQSQPGSTMGSSRHMRHHIASLYIRVQRNAASDELDDALDADELFVVEAVMGHDWTSLLEEEPELTQVNFTDSNDSAGLPVGTIVIRFDVRYRIDRRDPETAQH
jgi:hypothetical protein